MAHTLNRLTARRVETAKKSGLYVTEAASTSTSVVAARRAGVCATCSAERARWVSVSLSKIGLSDAKEGGATRLLLVERVDPLARRDAEGDAQRIEAARAITFDDCAAAYIKAHEAGWRNAKHRQQWANTLATYVTPIFGSVLVGHVDVAMVMKVLEPLWATKPETAGRVRGRVEAVLDWARARGFREGENPARWRGHLSNLLPAAPRSTS